MVLGFRGTKTVMLQLLWLLLNIGFEILATSQPSTLDPMQ